MNPKRRFRSPAAELYSTCHSVPRSGRNQRICICICICSFSGNVGRYHLGEECEVEVLWRGLHFRLGCHWWGGVRLLRVLLVLPDLGDVGGKVREAAPTVEPLRHLDAAPWELNESMRGPATEAVCHRCGWVREVSLRRCGRVG